MQELPTLFHSSDPEGTCNGNLKSEVNGEGLEWRFGWKGSLEA